LAIALVVMAAGLFLTIKTGNMSYFLGSIAIAAIGPVWLTLKTPESKYIGGHLTHADLRRFDTDLITDEEHKAMWDHAAHCGVCRQKMTLIDASVPTLGGPDSFPRTAEVKYQGGHLTDTDMVLFVHFAYLGFDQTMSNDELSAIIKHLSECTECNDRKQAFEDADDVRDPAL